MPALARGQYVDGGQINGALSEVTVYLGELGRAEAELLAAYEEVLRILDEAAVIAPGDSATPTVPHP